MIDNEFERKILYYVNGQPIYDAVVEVASIPSIPDEIRTKLLEIGYVDFINPNRTTEVYKYAASWKHKIKSINIDGYSFDGIHYSYNIYIRDEKNQFQTQFYAISSEELLTKLSDIESTLMYIEKIRKADITKRESLNAALRVLNKLNLPDSCIIAGSVGLVLHGCNIDRQHSIYEVDIITPYFQPLGEVNNYQAAFSGSDFDYSVNIGNIKVDIKIDPKAKYEIKQFNGKYYKVALLSDIIYYKAKYARKGQSKHQQDIRKISFL